MRRSRLLGALRRWFFSSHHFHQRVARAASHITMSVACLVLLGWSFDIPVLKEFFPGMSTMKANTAIGLLLAGLSLGLQTRQRYNLRTIRAAQGCAIVATIIAILTLCQYSFGWDLGIDQLLFHARPDAAETLYPGRMGVNTAIDLALIGIALWLLSQPAQMTEERGKINRLIVAQLLAIAVGLMSLQAVIGYAYQVQVFYQSPRLTTGMALHTALTFGILTIGMLALKSEQGVMRSLTSPLVGGVVARRFIPTAIVILVILGWLILQGQKAGWYDSNFAVSLMVMTLIAASLGLVGRNADTLNRMDRDRRRSFDQLRSSEERLQLAQMVTETGTWEWNVQTGKIVWSHPCYPLFGVASTEADLLTAFMSKVHAEDLPTIQAVVQQRTTLNAVELEYRYHHPERGLRWMFSRARAASDNPALLRGISLDITDRKQEQLERAQTQETICRQLAEIEAIYDTAPVGLGLFDRDLRFTRINQRLAEINGLSIADHLGRTVREIVPDLADDAEPLLCRVLETGEPLLNLEIMGETAAQPGVQRTWLEDLYPLRDAAGRPIGINVVVQEITQRKQAEIALRDKEQQLEQLSNSMPQFVWICGAHGELEYVNQQWCDYSGLSQEQSHDQTLIVSHYHPDDQASASAQWETALATQQLFEFEGRLRSAEGMYRWFLMRAVPVFDDRHQLQRWYGTSTDIHDRKLAELNDTFLNHLDAQLRQCSEPEAMMWEIVSRLGHYLNVDRCLLHSVDLEAGITTIRQDWRQADLESIAGVYSLSEYIPPEIIQCYQAGQSLVVDNVETHSSTVPIAHHLLERQIRALIGVPCIESGRWVASLMVHSRAIREWRSDEVRLLQSVGARFWALIRQTQAMQALRESEARFRTLADNIAQLAWIADASGSVFWYNQRWFEYTGITLEEMQDGGRQVVQHPDHIERVTQRFRHAIKTGEVWEDTFPLRGQDGQYRWFLSRAIPIRDEQGNILRWFGTNTDITDRKQLEDVLAAQTEELMHTNRLKDEFLAALSHELRTPLTPILGWTRLMQDHKLNPAKTAEALDIIQRSVKQQIALVDDLLDVSSVIQGKLHLKLQPLDLANVVAHAIETVQFTAQAKRIEIEVDNTAALPVLGDGDRLQQVFWNLLNNALKFTPEDGRIKVESSIFIHRNGIRSVQVRVIDTGIGIAPEFLPHVFDHFRQADSSSSRRFGGLGLGLSIVRHLVELHGGTVSVESPGIGQGTTFMVRFPYHTNCLQRSAPNDLADLAPMPLNASPALAPVISAPAEVLASEVQPSANLTITLKGLHILVVDDDQDNLELLRFLLEEYGAIVTAQLSAIDALDFLCQKQPDLIISDIGMPQVDGFEFIRRVRSLPQAREIPALALTAYAQIEDEAQAISSGFQGFITKPIDPLELLSKLIRLLKP
ncbi:MAG: PAS domain-containing protein [Leptolyngbya sp. UWPOB_LEPTO1]|uniref:PAS domain-containing protein n=1 Tax=Leptolyngbya sp. UWPOB_LEPTO1 TaxID=2815653 RepID=UPI001AD4CED6|nr:PAS domain-containing protein [Leptolyngbya sp. UWPOB_LEPTO1]MBN8561436.1 PAS domain-containing protein [Leptolyngbya sp. UWPOB_LEPTO1]